MNVEYRKWQNGTFQAWTTADSRETRTIDNMNWYTPSSDYSRTAWGGRNGLQPSSVTGKEGFFRVAHCGGRAYLLDPDNGAVILHGVQHVRPGESTAHQKAFSTKYGSESRWSEETGKLLADNHINYISYGSNRIETFPVAIRANLLTTKTQKIAYAETLYLLRTFMWDMTKNLGYAFDDDKYNRLILILRHKIFQSDNFSHCLHQIFRNILFLKFCLRFFIVGPCIIILQLILIQRIKFFIRHYAYSKLYSIKHRIVIILKQTAVI